MGGQEPAGRRPVTGVVIGLLVVAVVGWLARSDATDGMAALPGPTAASATATAEATATATPEATATATPTPFEAPSQGPRRPPAIDASVPRVTGTWLTDLPDAPIDVPAVHLGVWTGDQLVVGFEEEIAAFDPWGQSWRTLPSHPDGRADGRHVVLVEGFLDGPVTDLRDPAGEWMQRIAVVGRAPSCDAPLPCARVDLLDPVAGTWEDVPDPPAAVPTVDAVAWTRAELVLVWATRPPRGQAPGTVQPAVGGAVLDWASRTWRMLPPLTLDDTLPGDGGGRRPDTRVIDLQATAMRNDGTVLVWGGRERASSFAAVLDPSDDGWRVVPFPGSVSPRIGTWTSRGDLVVAGQTADMAPWFGSIRPNVRSWEPLAPLPGADDPRTSLYGWATAPAGERTLLYGGYASSVFLSYDPAGYAWEVLDVDRPRVHAVAAWTGSEFVIWGGYTEAGPTVDVAIWRPPLGWPG